MKHKYGLHIVAVVEKGLLEEQIKLLINSIEQFVSPALNVKVIACSPRTGYTASSETIQFFKDKHVDYIDKPLNEKYDYFPLCNGIFSCDYVVNHYPDVSSILLVDTDTLFLNPIEQDLLTEPAIYMRPVDNKGIGSEGENDPNHEFWLKVYDHFGIQDIPDNIETTVSRDSILPYYNSGFVLASQCPEFMTQWKQDFITLMESDIRTNPTQSRHQVDYGFIEQMVLSISSLQSPVETLVPNNKYNYPIPFKPKLELRPNAIQFNESIHVHYHKWFQHPGFLDYVTNEIDKQSKQYLWLKQQLPLMPTISGKFKC